MVVWFISATIHCICVSVLLLVFLLFSFHSFSLVTHTHASISKHGIALYASKFHKSFDSLIRKAIINLHRLFSTVESKRQCCSECYRLTALCSPILSLIYCSLFSVHLTMIAFHVVCIIAIFQRQNDKAMQNTVQWLNDFMSTVHLYQPLCSRNVIHVLPFVVNILLTLLLIEKFCTLSEI